MAIDGKEVSLKKKTGISHRKKETQDGVKSTQEEVGGLGVNITGGRISREEHLRSPDAGEQETWGASTF